MIKPRGKCGNMNYTELGEFYNGKTVLVTGHTGFKGAWLCKILEMFGSKVYGYALNPPTDPNLYDIIKKKNIHSEIGDISDFEHIYDYFKSVEPEIVIHMAAQPIVRESYIRPLATYQTNVMGTACIMECLRRTECTQSFLNVTTDKVYDNKDVDKFYNENDPLDGFDPYSNSKSCSELVTHSYKRSFFEDKKCKISTARAGNVIGGGDFAKDRIIPDCIRAALSKKEIIVRNPNSIRPYQHVLEPLFAYLTITYKQALYEECDGCYNVGPREEDCVSTGELVTLFCNTWGSDQKWISLNDNGPHEANYLKLDSTLIKNKLSFNPRWHIDKAISATVEWTKCWNSEKDVDNLMEKQITEYMG